ncbi:hypothetical protein BS78_01G260400 [Paspalum vaginatum]|nr:hypothetical protein BS78_01G260400 [Paspalum vaginatum]
MLLRPAGRRLAHGTGRHKKQWRRRSRPSGRCAAGEPPRRARRTPLVGGAAWQPRRGSGLEKHGFGHVRHRQRQRRHGVPWDDARRAARVGGYGGSGGGGGGKLCHGSHRRRARKEHEGSRGAGKQVRRRRRRARRSATALPGGARADGAGAGRVVRRGRGRAGSSATPPAGGARADGARWRRVDAGGPGQADAPGSRAFHERCRFLFS